MSLSSYKIVLIKNKCSSEFIEMLLHDIIVHFSIFQYSEMPITFDRCDVKSPLSLWIFWFVLSKFIES